MKLYVFQPGCLRDWGDGILCVMADNVRKARKLGYDHLAQQGITMKSVDECGGLGEHRIAKNGCAHLYGSC